MKVQDLIRQLQHCDPEAVVVAYDPFGTVRAVHSADSLGMWRDAGGYFTEDRKTGSTPEKCVLL